ncbi:MAG TPA: SCO family protein [Solirubrobacteraceae bacterium]|nr:SCO family protein [Solirubrobacteraceae bacterium]
MPPKLRFLLPAVSAALAIALLVTIVFGGCSGGGPSSQSVTRSASQNRFDGAAFPPGVRARDFMLRDQHGHSVSLNAHRGEVVALAFLSTDCRACVLVAQQVRGALDELGAAPGVRTIFVSTDPHADTHARVGRFLSETSLSGRVEYLTGTSAQLRPVWRTYRVPPASAGKSASEAATTVLLIDRAGTERVGFGLEQITPEGVTHDIRLLQAG